MRAGKNFDTASIVRTACCELLSATATQNLLSLRCRFDVFLDAGVVNPKFLHHYSVSLSAM
jgi:hypothetical protein